MSEPHIGILMIPTLHAQLRLQRCMRRLSLAQRVPPTPLPAAGLPLFDAMSPCAVRGSPQIPLTELKANIMSLMDSPT